MISAELKVVGGKHAGQIIPLNRRKFLIGREQDCQLRPNSEMVSRHHCVFSVDDYSVRLRDLGSTNGTLVNGDRIRKETVLADGDRILIGNLDFQLVLRAGVTVPDSDSAILPTGVLAALETQVTAPSGPAAPEIGSPTAVASDTTVTLPVTVPGVAAAGSPPVPGFAGMEQGGGMMPGFGQMYNPMMPQMGYPMPGGMMGGMPAAPVAAPAAAPAEASINVALPDPSTTGAKEAEAAKGSTGSNTKDTAKPTGAADAIIKQYLGRRPGG